MLSEPLTRRRAASTWSRTPTCGSASSPMPSPRIDRRSLRHRTPLLSQGAMDAQVARRHPWLVSGDDLHRRLGHRQRRPRGHPRRRRPPAARARGGDRAQPRQGRSRRGRPRRARPTRSASPPPTTSTRSWAPGPSAVVYAASGDIRPDDALADIVRAIRAGAVVVTPAIYALYDPSQRPARAARPGAGRHRRRRRLAVRVRHRPGLGQRRAARC